MNCPKCGFKVWKKDKYCRHCGEEVKYKKRSIKHYRDTRLYLILNILLGNTGIHDIYIGRNIRAGIHIILFINIKAENPLLLSGGMNAAS